MFRPLSSCTGFLHLGESDRESQDEEEKEEEAVVAYGGAECVGKKPEKVRLLNLATQHAKKRKGLLRPQHSTVMPLSQCRMQCFFFFCGGIRESNPGHLTHVKYRFEVADEPLRPEHSAS